MEESPSAPEGRRSLKCPAHGTCQVCLQKAHGIHFGVLTCRACAAFFRRTVVLNRTYACRRADGSCEISKNERYLCRQCRFNKCIALGMTPENVQWNRDSLSAVEGRRRKKDPVSDDEEEEEEDYGSRVDSTDLPTVSSSSTSPPPESMKDPPRELERCLPIALQPFRRNAPPKDQAAELAVGITFPPEKCLREVIFKNTQVRAKLMSVLETFDAESVSPEIIDQTPLMRMHTALHRHRANQQRNLMILEEIDIVTVQPFWEQSIYNIAEWLMYSREFVAMPASQKLAMFKNCWVVWQRLERLQMSIEIYGEGVLTDKCIAVSDNCAVKMDKLKIDVSVISNYDSEYIKGIFSPLMDRILEDVIRPMLDLNVTPFELTYMLCQLAFHVEGRVLDDMSQRVSIAFRNRVSDDLHHYYTNVMNQPNYANRLIRLMNIMHALESIQNERAKVLELARIFDVFKIDICEESIFDCC